MNSVLMRAYIAPPDSDKYGLLMEQRRELARVTGAIFGGCTIIDGYGSWLDSAGELIMEDMFIVEVSFNKQSLLAVQDQEMWFTALNKLGLKWNQKSILYVTQEAQGNFWDVTNE